MLELNEIQSGTEKADITLKNGKILTMDIDPDIITGKFLEDMKELVNEKAEEGKELLSDETKQTRFMAEVLARMVKNTGITNEGVPIPPSVEFFNSRPVSLLTDMFRGCMSKITPKKTIETPSGDSTHKAEN